MLVMKVLLVVGALAGVDCVMQPMYVQSCGLRENGELFVWLPLSLQLRHAAPSAPGLALA